MINLLKAIFIDIDGTLRVNKKIDEKIINSLEALNNLGVKVIITTDAHYLRKEDAKVQDMLMCIQMGKNLEIAS